MLSGLSAGMPQKAGILVAEFAKGLGSSQAMVQDRKSWRLPLRLSLRL